MKKFACVILSFFLIVSITLQYNIIILVNSIHDEIEFVIKSSVKFSALSKEWNFTEDEKAISLYMNNSWQTVNLINSSHPFENVKTDEDENKIAILNLSNIKPGESIEYTVFYRALSKPRNLPDIVESAALNLTNIPDDLKENYCKNSGTWMTHNSTLRELAENLVGDETNVLVIVKKLVRWIWDNIKYKSHEMPFFPNETLLFKEGDCDEQSILLISLCRIIGIPSYLQIGCIYLPGFHYKSSAWNGTVSSIQVRIGWHGWAMVYIPPWDWLPVDLTYSSRNNPLDAIKTAAVVSQDAIQYMQIINSDYISNAREYRGYLIKNDFHISIYDEIFPKEEDIFGFLFETPTKYILIVFLSVGVAVGSTLGIFYIRRMRKTREGTL